MSHPDENQLNEFVAGLLAPEARALVDTHLVSCASCRQLVAAVASEDGGQAPRTTTVLPPRTESKEISLTGTLEAGEHIGRYVVLNRIGEGGMGVVYAAHDPNLNRRVAIKVLRSEDDFGSQRARLFREAQAMARLSHPNVVNVYDVGTHEEHVFLAMEHVDGVTLSDWLVTPRTTREILDVFLQAGTGLAAAHAAGLVHRDFKPSNVLVEGEGRARVTDFGLARTASSSDVAKLKSDPTIKSMEMTELTRTGTVMGTPAYMSPEQIFGEQTDLRTDQFSFCVALYEALFAVRPFRGSDLATIGTEITSGRVQPPANARSTTARLRRAILRGLDTLPDRRFHSMEALCDELRAARKPAWIPVAGFVALALVAAGVTWRVMAVSAGPVPKVVVAKPAPPAVAALPAETPAPAPVKAAVDPAPAVPAAPAAPEPVHARPASATGSKHAAKSGAAKAAGGMGILSLHVAPWGDMFIDDKKLDSANMMDSVAELAAGPHRLKVTNPKLGERTEQIVIEASKTLDKKIDLARGR
jgi:predicted Ser/Thr protein kinase